MQAEAGATIDADDESVPTLDEIADAINHHLTVSGAVKSGVATALAAEKGWHGRLMDVLSVITDDVIRMGYLAGGRRPEEVLTWLGVWAESPLSLEEIRTIVRSGGWDPDPFSVLVKNGLLYRFVYQRDGSLRRIRGEFAGAWLSDQFALAEDNEILAAVHRVLEGEAAA